MSNNNTHGGRYFENCSVFSAKIFGNLQEVVVLPALRPFTMASISFSEDQAIWVMQQ